VIIPEEGDSVGVRRAAERVKRARELGNILEGRLNQRLRALLSKGMPQGMGRNIAKNGDSIYVSRRTRDWLKFKCQEEQEFVIGS
jgi:ATP-dependent DNA ligase